MFAGCINGGSGFLVCVCPLHWHPHSCNRGAMYNQRAYVHIRGPNQSVFVLFVLQDTRQAGASIPSTPHPALTRLTRLQLRDPGSLSIY